MIIRNKIHVVILMFLLRLLDTICSSVEYESLTFESITTSMRRETLDLPSSNFSQFRNTAVVGDDVDDDDASEAPTDAPTVLEVVPSPTSRPTPEPTRKTTRSPTHSPTMKPTAFPTASPTAEDWKNKVQDEEEEILKIVGNKTAEILAGILVFSGFIGMVITAYCTMNFPDGICASCCQLIFSLAKLLSKIICLPCDLIRYRGYTSSEAADRSMFLERAEGHTSDLELI